MKRILRKLIILTMLLGAIGGYEIPQNIETVQAAHHKNRHHNSRKHKTSDHSGKRRKLKTKHKKRLPWANVYIGISKKSDDYWASKDAIKAWNATKAVKLRIVKKAKNAYIKIHHRDYGDTGWAGEEITKLVLRERGYISYVRLNDYFLNIVDYPIKVCVAEHELGHSLGLDHIDGQPSVMNSIVDPDNAYPIQPVDVATLKKLYHEK